MVEVTEEFDFTQSAQAEHAVIEGRYTLYGNLALSWDVDGRAAGDGLMRCIDAEER